MPTHIHNLSDLGRSRQTGTCTSYSPRYKTDRMRMEMVFKKNEKEDIIIFVPNFGVTVLISTVCVLTYARSLLYRVL